MLGGSYFICENLKVIKVFIEEENVGLCFDLRWYLHWVVFEINVVICCYYLLEVN